MDTTAPPTAPVINDSPQSSSNKSSTGKFLIVAALILLAGIGGALYYVTQLENSKPITSTSPSKKLNELFESTKSYAKINDETIYGSDLNFTINFFFGSMKKDNTTEQLKSLAMDKIQADTILLQEDQKTTGKKLSPTIYNNPNKDQMARQRRVQELQEGYQKQEQAYTGEQLSVWYYNVRPPKIPELEAKTLVQQKINAIYSEITQNKITFKDAKEKIINDTELSKTDVNYKGNAHFSFEQVTRSNPLFSFKTLNDTLFSMKEGEISKVLDISDKEGQREEFFAILKVNKIENSQTQSYEEWLNDKKTQYLTINL